MRARSAVMMLMSSMFVFGGPGAASAHRMPPPPARADVDVRLVCDGSPCEEVYGRGQRYVVANFGQRYTVALTNRSARWVEAVVFVDGRSVVDGHRPSTRSRGYLIPPYEQIEVEGWRTSASEVAAFRFTSAGDSYAGRVGDTSQLGTIRVDVFPERGGATWIPRPTPIPYGGWDDGVDAGSGRGAESESSPKRESAGAAAAPESRRWRDYDRQNLGTEYGESRWQPVTERDFVRADPHRPAQVLTLRYDDRHGLVTRGVLAPPRWTDEGHGHWVAPPPPRGW